MITESILSFHPLPARYYDALTALAVDIQKNLSCCTAPFVPDEKFLDEIASHRKLLKVSEAV